ncbi:bifunctional phosphoribosylaminoimidazole carboxylase/phosphoribosylaminoimidazole succinocarboxamide synthetase isoform X1 [Centroberyx affinis]|uniref:bifunctional phosphoribosylaminoimidazole carboxylase/phosphoribosylaminoimidazole succinocarboxamide synthetase isoform X1 n=1 Tax=Centroberyx affinis TaxID=166261 RepID=UPI003A5BA69E
MEGRAERQRGGDNGVVEVNAAVERQWGEAEALALMSVWEEVGAQHMGESRATFELISERLRRLSVLRSWRECQAKSRSLGLQSRKTEAADTSTNYSQRGDSHLTSNGRPVEGWEEEEEEMGNERGIYSSSVTVPVQEGIKGRIHGALPPPYTQCVAEEGGRHWTDEEVRALLCVWADRRIRERLKCTLRNKSIFQEMARQMQRSFGVVRNWKQCRTKYKNLKYEYKTAKSAQAAGGGSGGGPGKYMKFFDEVEAILLDQGLDDGTQEMQKRLCDGEIAAGRLGSPAGQTTQTRAIENELVIEIDDDDNSDDYEIDVDMDAKWRGTDVRLSPIDPSGSDQFHVVTVSDTGRNWSDQEVRALIQVWSEEGVCRQLESSTRKRDIFVQISNRLMQQGIERDWKQCHTKYKNLKYLYRSLQRGKADAADPRRLMRFYDEVDAILNRTTNGSPHNMGYIDHQAESGGSTVLDGCEEDGSTDVSLPKVDTVTSMMGAEEERTSNADSVSSMSLEIIPNNAEPRLHTGKERGLDQQHRFMSPTETRVDKEDTLPANRGMKRKAMDQDTTFRPVKRLHTGTDCADRMELQCKEEQDHIPIIEINSVCSMASPNLLPERQDYRFSKNNMASTSELKIGKKLNEGKTKQIFELVDQPGLVLVQSKDQITAGNAVRKDQMEGKAAIANKTTSCVFKLLQESGIKTAFEKQHSDTAFIATHCEMIPIEWVCRRVATGSFLKRNPGVKEGYRFSPLKMEMFFKDDANNDPQWSEEQLLEAKFSLAGLTIGQCEVDIMNRSTVAIFEILEKAWATQNCTLVDMKIEFGVNVTTKEIVLADVIDNDSWRLWPAGDRSQQKDKQVYRDLKEVTPEAMQMVKRNFEWVSERVKLLLEPQAGGRVVVLMGSTSDMAHCEKIRKACTAYGIPCILRVTSAHKGPDETLRIKAQYEGDGIPTVFVAVAGRSNGLGPVMSGNTAYPVINCPPLTPDWGAQDVWSSLRMPSGLGCSTVLSPEAAAQFAAQIFGLTDHLVWCKLRASMLNTWVSLKLADKKLQACSL